MINADLVKGSGTSNASPSALQVHARVSPFNKNRQIAAAYIWSAR